MTIDTYKLQMILAAHEAFRRLIAEEAEYQFEQEMQNWMNQLDQDDQAIQDFCDGLD